MYASSHRGLGCRRRPLGDVWTSLDDAAIWIVDTASFPFNLINGGQLTDAQKQALILQGQDQILAVADSPGAQVSPAVATATRAAAIRNAMQVAGGNAVVQAFQAPTNSDIDLSLLQTGLGAQANAPATSNYGLWLLG